MNKKNLTLVILAAGMGSRYGGLKQLDTFTTQKETILDFSIFDAIEAGFTKVIFIIRKSFEKEFKAVFNDKLKGKITIEYVYQELEAIPKTYINPERTKPWGTGHALLMCKNIIKENFAVINADDFYGKKAFKTIAIKLKETKSESYDFSMIGYILKNTLSENGYVSRGECTIDKKGNLTEIRERTRIETVQGVLKFENEYKKMIPIDENTIVSMNFWGFTPKCFEFIEPLFLKFLEKNKENIKAEFYIPSVVNTMLASKKVAVKVLETSSKWFGVTYNEDKEKVKNEIRKLKENGLYPKNLWL